LYLSLGFVLPTVLTEGEREVFLKLAKTADRT
jgi:hypothetical protein